MKFLLTNLARDLRTYGARTAIWNARFLVGWAILPGSKKKVKVR